MSSRTFIVPKSDPDCDDFTDGNLECADLAWMSYAPPPLEEVSCTLRDNKDPDRQFCMLGGPGCVDGQGTVSCGPSDYCIPSELCGQCDSAAGKAAVRQCLASALTGAAVDHTKTQLPGAGRQESSSGCRTPCPTQARFVFATFEQRIPHCTLLELAASPSVMNGVGPFSGRRDAEDSKCRPGEREAELKVSVPRRAAR